MSIEKTGLDGPLPEGRIAIVASRYNASICDALVQGSLETLTKAGYPSDAIEVVRVPGAWEMVLATKHALQGENMIAAVTLGCVIQGETTHDEHINRAVSLAIMDLGLETMKPIGFGLLTCRTLEQAINRSGGTVGNKGHEAAEAVLEMLRLLNK